MNLRTRVVAICGAAVLALVSTQVRPQQPFTLPACIDALRGELALHPQVRPATFETHTREVRDIRALIRAATDSQPEFKLAIWDYIARLVDAQRIADGQRVLEEQASVLPSIVARGGVDGATMVAVFGVETDYGRVAGRHRVIDATLSRACLDMKNKERKQHFFAALWLLQQGLVQAENFSGSWAGVHAGDLRRAHGVGVWRGRGRHRRQRARCARDHGQLHRQPRLDRRAALGHRSGAAAGGGA
jgi:membrane-bound lytic murein transglycosylase B